MQRSKRPLARTHDNENHAAALEKKVSGWCRTEFSQQAAHPKKDNVIADVQYMINTVLLSALGQRSLWLPAPSTQQRQWNLSSKSLCASNRSHRGHGEYEGLCAATAGIGAQGRKGSVPPVQLDRCTTCPLRILTTTSKRAGRLWPWRTQLDMSRHVIHAVSGGKFQVFQWTDVFYVPFWRSKRYHTVPSCLVSLVDMFATST